MLLLRKLFLLGIFLFISQLSYAQSGSIEGVVTDQETEEVLSGVNVGIKNTSEGGATNEEGAFEITGISPGNYTLIISAVGYAQKEVMVSVSANQTTTANVELIKTFTELQEVEIIGRSEQSYKSDYSFAATKTATLTKDIPQAISVITKELLVDQQSYRLGEVAKNISGVNTFSGYDDLTMRGFRNSDSHGRLINGLRSGFVFGLSL